MFPPPPNFSPKGGPTTTALRKFASSPLQYDVIAPVLLPALLVVYSTERLLFAVTDGVDPVGAHTLLLQ